MGKRAKKYGASRAGGGASSSSTGNRNGEASTSGQNGDQSGGQSGVRVGSLDTNVEQVENQKQEGGETEWLSAQREMRGANVEKLMSEMDLKNRAFETDLAEHEEELSHLKRHMQAMKYEGFKRDLDFSELKEEVVGLTSEVSALKGEASKLKGEVEMLKSQVAIHPKNSVHPVQELGIEQIGKQKADFESLKAGDDAPKSLQNDLLIVGPGALGRIVADKWRMDYPDSQIIGETLSTYHHDELLKLGISPCLKGSTGTRQFPYVMYCASPFRTPHYTGDIRQAALRWRGDGSFLFISSSEVYDCNDNGLYDEDSQIVPLGRSPGTDVLLKAEKAALEADGCVLRLAGLYQAEGGAHKFCLEKGESRPNHILNLIHVEDAASLSVAILKMKVQGQIFLGCDNHPFSRQKIMDCVSKSGKFSKTVEGLTGANDPFGKQLNNSKTRAKIGWEPKYASFAHFLESVE